MLSRSLPVRIATCRRVSHFQAARRGEAGGTEVIDALHDAQGSRGTALPSRRASAQLSARPWVLDITKCGSDAPCMV